MVFFSCSKKICVSKVDKNKSKTGILKTAILMKIIIVLIRVWVVLKRRSQSNLIICKKKIAKLSTKINWLRRPKRNSFIIFVIGPCIYDRFIVNKYVIYYYRSIAISQSIFINYLSDVDYLMPEWQNGRRSSTIQHRIHFRQMR